MLHAFSFEFNSLVIAIQFHSKNCCQITKYKHNA